jgi:hypothetical protein|tara:strand:- start:6663 stop:7082 length:420 start_codon:yes stop_codon:yes gene_type:complete
MDDISKRILLKVGLQTLSSIHEINTTTDKQISNENVNNTIGMDFDTIDGLFIPRDMLLDESKYNSVKDDISDLKKKLSSSSLTSLQNNAKTNQKWPLINLIRQILHVYRYNMVPIRKSDGYTKDGVKKFKRFFQIKKTV